METPGEVWFLVVSAPSSLIPAHPFPPSATLTPDRCSDPTTIF